MRTLLISLALIGSANAETLVIGNKAEHTLSFVDLASGEEIARRETGRFPHEIVVTPDGTTAIVVSYRGPGYNGNTLHLFNVAAAEEAGEISLGDSRGPHGLKWIPGTDDVIVTTEVSEDVVIVTPSEKKVRQRIKTNQQGSHMVAVAPDGERAYVANIASGSFTVVDIAKGTKVRDVKAGEGTEAITVSPDGNDIIVGNNGSKSVMVFDAKSFKQKRSFETTGIPIRVETSPDGTLLAVSQPDLSNVVFYRYEDFDLIAQVDLGSGTVPVTMLFSPDGTKLWAAATGAAKVMEIDTGSFEIVRSFNVGQGSDGLAYSPVELIAVN